MRRLTVAVIVLFAFLGVPSQAPAQAPGTASNFELVGHNPLIGPGSTIPRGENAALAIFDHFVYTGSRTDASATCVPETGVPDAANQTCPHLNPGVLIVDIANPADPQVVGEIGPPHEGNLRETSRELRVWPEQQLLMVMTFRCSRFYHACLPPPPTPTPRITFYDLRNPANPTPVSTLDLSPQVAGLIDPRPHEFFLWVDPKAPTRHALLYITTFSNDADTSLPNVFVVDISRAREGIFSVVAKLNVVSLYPKRDQRLFYVAVHSLGVSPDGTRAYLASWGGHYLELDTSDLARGVPNPKIRLLTPIQNRPTWPNPAAHSAVTVPGRPLAIVTDELYGDYDDVNDPPRNKSGCPWGWARIIDRSDPARPRIVGEYKVAENDPSFCETPIAQDPSIAFTAFTSHNLTVTKNLTFIAWHSAGLHAIDITNPANPTTAGVFVPQPLPEVATEDPALSRGPFPTRVVMWSYPIIRQGLIYVVDIRNGLYVLRYTGPFAQELKGIGFLEGNSNVGDALRLDRS